MSRRRRKFDFEQLVLLQGRRLRLRTPQAGDATAIYDYACDPEVTRYLAWPRHTRLADTEQFLRIALEGWQGGRYLVWLIEDESGVVGAIGAELSGSNAGVGYVLARRCWGRGYATEALGLVSEALFAWSPVATLWALCVPENTASQRVLEKGGFRCERTMEHYLRCPNLGGALQDVLLFAREKATGHVRAD